MASTDVFQVYISTQKIYDLAHPVCSLNQTASSFILRNYV